MTDFKTCPPLPLSLAQRFEIESVLGQGGFGLVFKATQVDLKRRVALKVLYPHHLGDVQTRSRFVQEAQLMARLCHETIVPILDYGVEEGFAYLVLPFVEGGSLRSRIAQGALPWTQVATHAMRIAEALQIIHAENVVHRDLKPENVLLNEVGEALVTDFGISKPLGTTLATTTGLVLGTPGYISPEQAVGLVATPRSDLYSLGVMVWEMVAGYRPHEREDPSDPSSIRPPAKELVATITEHPPNLPRTTVVPQALARLIFDLMAKEPEDRPNHARDVIAVLADVLRRSRHGRCVPVAPPQTRPTFHVARERRRVFRTLVAAIALAVALSITVQRSGRRRSSEPNVLPPAVSATTEQSPSESSDETNGLPDEAREARRIQACVEERGMSLIPWRERREGNQENSIVRCPVVLACRNRVRKVAIDVSAGCKLDAINGRQISSQGEARSPDPWRAGLNWVWIAGHQEIADCGTVRFERDSGPDRVHVQTSPPPDFDAFGAVATCLLPGAALPGGVSEARECARRIPSESERSAVESWIDARAMAAWLETDRSRPGFFWRDEGSLKQAFLCLEKAQKLLDGNPTGWTSWHLIGLILDNTGHLDSAAVAYGEALMIRPEAYWTWYELHVHEKRRSDILARTRVPREKERTGAWHGKGSAYYLRLARRCAEQRQIRKRRPDKELRTFLERIERDAPHHRDGR